MKGFVWVGAECADGETLQDWIQLAESYVDTLVPK
jgi:hypothetical protein